MNRQKLCVAQSTPPAPRSSSRVIVAVVVFVVSFTAVSLMSRGPVSYFDLKLITAAPRLPWGQSARVIVLVADLISRRRGHFAR